MLKKLSKRIASLLLAFVLVAGVPFSYGCVTPPEKNLCATCGQEPCVCDDTPEPTARSIGFVTGTGQDIDPIVAEPGEKVSAPKAPVRDGFVFDGWLLDGAPYEFGTMPDEDIELVAKWNQIFKITFDTGVDDLIVAPILSIQGEIISAPPDPMQIGQRFAGWYDGDGERFYFTTMPAKDVKLTAKWAKVVKITLNTGVMGLDVAPISELPGTPISAPPDPERAGFLFLGWYLGGAETAYTFTVVPDSDIRLDAKWVAAATISFATGVPGLTVAPIKAPVGSDVKKPKDPVRTDGYLFDGWLLSGEPYKFTVIPSRDITLTAKWTASCTITFNADADDIEVPALVQVPGRSIKPPDAPLRAGFYLEGWYRPDGKRFIFNVMPSASVTLKAKWVETSKLPTVTVTLHNEDGSIISIEDTRFAPTPWSAGWPNTDTKPQVRYLDCTYGITNSKGEPEFISGVIKPKGNGSFRANPYVRRPYRVKLDQKTSFFGWPKSKQYTLAAVSHNNNDPSRLVTHSGYALARSEALPGIEFGARSQPVDLYINGVYRGVYVFTETVKVEEGRLEIESEYAGIHAGTSADPYVTDTGYLLFFGSDQHTVIGEDPRAVFKISGVGQSFLMESPHVDDVDDPEIPEATGAGYRAQREYITGQTQNLYNMMTAANYNEFLRVADIDSFVDGYILQELYRNEDIDSGGYYLYKKSPAQGGKWYAGPPWDLDCTTKDGGIEGITVGPGGGWGNNPFITRLYNIPAFLTRVKARWAEVSGDVKEFITNAFNEYINDPGYAAAFRRGAGGDTGIHANAGYSSVASSNWVSIAEGKRNWLIARAGWLDGAWG